MIILLDSNFRNRALYNNPSSYVIELNGTPPISKQDFDARGFNVTNNNISFSFYFFKQLRDIPYKSYSLNTITINIKESYFFKHYINLRNNILVNFLVGYIAQDTSSARSSIITSNYIYDNKLIITTEYPITTPESKSKLNILNPSLSCKNNLLINGYSKFNFTPNLGYYQNDGINSSSLVLNISRDLQTSIKSLEQPYRNIIFDPISSNNLSPFQVEEGDYIVILNSKTFNVNITNFSSRIVDFFPSSLFDFSIVEKNFTAHDVKKGDVFISYFGQDVSTTYPIYKEVNFEITELTPTRKIRLRISEIFGETIRFDIEQPGNGIALFNNYNLFLESEPSKFIKIVARGVKYSLLLEKPINKILDRYLVFFLTMYAAVPYYASVIESKDRLLYIEDPNFDDDSFIYDRVGYIPFYSSYPNLSLPISNCVLTCYKVRISNISLPNLPICGSNKLLADFPYVLVSFGNATDINNEGKGGTNNINTLWSNDPNAQNATFLCAIANIKSPDIIKYVVVKSQQVVTIKLNLAQNLRFSVFLPSGKLLSFTNSFEIAYQRFYVVSNNCDTNNSLTLSSTTKVYPFDEEVAISATFFIIPV